MDEATVVYAAKRGRNTGSDEQEPSELHGLAEEPGERIAPRVRKQQSGLPALAQKLQRPHYRRTVELILQSVFVSQPINKARRGVVRGGKHGQHGRPAAVTVIAPTSAEDALTVLPQHYEAACS